jgi:adenylate kinase family enzyme
VWHHHVHYAGEYLIMMATRFSKIAIIGNGGGGKSTLAKAIASAKGLPMLEVDHVQFAPGWVRVDPKTVARICDEFALHESWIIDGFGPWESIVNRFRMADVIVFVDFPVWIHFLWAAERQIAAEKGLAIEGPPGCDYRGKMGEMFETLWYVDQNVRPKIIEELGRLEESKKIVHLRSPEELELWKMSVII